MLFCDFIMRQIDHLKKFLPLLLLLKTRGMQRTHIDEINKNLKTEISMKETNFCWLA